MFGKYYSERIKGRIRLAMIKPPTINEIVAINEGS
jgi:hypothetical protein